MLKYFFYLTLSLLSLNQFTAISKSGDSSFYLFDFSVIAFALYGVIYFLAVKKTFKLPKYSFLFFLFSGVLFASWLANLGNFPFENMIFALFYLLRFISYLISGVVLYNMLENKLLSKNELFYAIVYSGVFISVIGFIQLIFLPDLGTLPSSLGWDPHKNRLVSTFFDPNFVGAYLVICLCLLGDKLLSKKTYKKIDVAYFVVILLALVLTFSRSAWGMFGVVIIIYGLFKSPKLLIVSLFVFLSVYFAVPRIQTRLSGITDPADSASLRLVSWGNAWQIIKDNYFIGTGFNTYRYAQQSYGFLTPDNENIHSGSGADSSLLFVFATSGIIGLVSYLSALGFILVESLKNIKNGGILISSIILGLLLESQFINSLFYPQILFLFLIISFSFLSK